MAFQPPSVDEIEKDQPKFTPPAPDAFDLSQVGTSPYDKYRLAISEGAAPENYSELGLPPSLNPDYDIVRESGYAGPMLKAVGEVAGKAGELAGDIAVKAADIPTDIANIGKTPDSYGYRPTLEERTSGGRNIITFPHAPSMKGEGAIAETAEGISNLAADTATSLLGRPQSALLLPMIPGEGAVSRVAAGAFGASTAAAVPDEINKAFTVLNDPNSTTAQKVAATGSPIVQSTLAAMMLKHATTEGVPNASRVTSPEGIPLSEVRQPVGQEAPLRQQGETAPTQGKAAQSKVPLTGEYHDLLAPHWDEDKHVMGTLGPGRVAVADHATGKVVVDPEQFTRFVDNDLKGMSPEQKAAAVKTMFDEEDIHLKTDPEDADKYEVSLSPLEKHIFTRNYLRGNMMVLSPRNLGFEVIRKRVQQARSMPVSEFIGLSLKERWTAKSLDALAETVARIRRLKDKELNDHQKQILDKVLENIGAARAAAPPQQGQQDKREYVEGPFSLRKGEPEEGKVRLYRGHEGGEGGAYWSTDQTYASRMGPKMEFVDVPADQLGDHAVRSVEGSGTPNAFKLPPDMTKGAQPLESAGVPTHNLDDLESPLPPLAPGERVVLVKRPDGSLYRAAYSGKQYDVSAGGKAMIDRYGGKLVDSIAKLNERGEWSHGMLPKGDKIIKGFSPYAAVERSGGPEGPSMLRKKNKPGEQPEMFGAVTKLGVPGGEDVQPLTAGQAGAQSFTPEQKIFPEEIDWQEGAKSPQKSSMPVRPITASEAKNATELSKFLTEDARKEGSDLPVSASRRLTALFDKADGSVHLVSTYRGDGVARMVDPAIAGKERNSRPVDELLHRYSPIASILIREPKQGFHQKFDSMADFQDKFGDAAATMAREHGTGFGGIPMTEVGRASPLEPEYALRDERYTKSSARGGRVQQGATAFRYPSEREPNLVRPTTEELKSFHDFFGDTPPSDALMFSRRIETQAANASRAMISGLRKMVRMERAQTRGLSEGEALGRVFDRLYENFSNSETRSEFVQRTMEQGRIGNPEEIPAGGAARTSARDLTTLRSRAPTEVAGATPGTGAPLPEGVPAAHPEMLSPEEQAALDAEIRKHHPPQFEVTPGTTLGKQVLETKVPKQRYSVGKSKTLETVQGEGEEAPEGSDALEEFDKEKFRQQRREDRQKQLFPEREMFSEAPPKPKSKEELVAEKKAVAKGEGNKGQLDFWKQQGPAMMRRAEELKEETAKAIGVITAYAKRKASEQELSASRDAVDSKFAIAGDQVDKAIRLASANKAMPKGKPEVLKAAPTVVQAGAYTVDYPLSEDLKAEQLTRMEADPIWKNILGLFSSEDALDKARGGQMLKKLKRDTVLEMVDDGAIDWRTGTVKYNKSAIDNLDKFGNYLDTAQNKAEGILASKGGGMDGMLERRAARARLAAVKQMRGQLEYARAHWNEPELQDTAAKMVMELEGQHRQEREAGMRVKRSENYLPGRYDEQWFDGDRIHFLEGPRILGRNFRKPATFSNYYEAIAAGNYLPFNMDGAGLVSHRVRQGMRQVETRLWEKGLTTLRDPHSGKPMVATPVRRPDGSYTGPSPDYELVDFGNRYMAVHKGSVDIIKALVGDSIIRSTPVTRRAMQFSQKLKHTILFLDTFHLGRLKAYDWSINGIGRGGYKGGLSILEYRPEDVPEAVRKGLLRQEDVDWANEPVTVNLTKGTASLTRRQVSQMFIHKGLNVGRIADAIYKVEGLGPVGQYNHWLFDKMTRGLMLETAVKEFERLGRDNPKTDYRKLIGDIALDTNNYMGSIGRQGWIKNQSFQDIFRMFGLAPQWVEGLIKKETALPGRLSGLSHLAGRRDVPLLGTAGRGIARGLATMFAVTQAINLITRRQPTWKNEEEGHKWDAWIPDATGKSEGFFLSPLSLFNEITHDIIRLSGTKPTVYDALHQIGENKLGPYGKAAMVLATGETPDHRKITSTAGMAGAVGKALLPVPISLGKLGQAGLSLAGVGQAPAPGSVQRQAMSSLGVKTEPAPSASSQIYQKADEFVKANGLNRSTGWQQVQTDELGYTDLRHAAATGDKKSFDSALEKLRQSRTDEQIYHAMKLWNRRAFTGSKKAEQFFISNLDARELDLYSRARLERQKTFSSFEDMLVDELSRQSPPPK